MEGGGYAGLGLRMADCGLLVGRSPKPRPLSCPSILHAIRNQQLPLELCQFLSRLALVMPVVVIRSSPVNDVLIVSPRMLPLVDVTVDTREVQVVRQPLRVDLHRS